MIAAILLCAAVSLSRINLGAHYLSYVWVGTSISLFLQVLVIHHFGKNMAMKARFSKALHREMFKYSVDCVGFFHSVHNVSLFIWYIATDKRKDM